LKSGVLEKRLRNRRGWGIFTDEDLEIIQAKAKRICFQHIAIEGKNSKTELKKG
jgi:hypothetical protein